jgi:hypothetical protein
MTHGPGGYLDSSSSLMAESLNNLLLLCHMHSPAHSVVQLQRSQQPCCADTAGVVIEAGGAVGLDTAGLVNGADGGNVDGVVIAGLVVGTVGEEVEGVGSGYVPGAGVVEEGGCYGRGQRVQGRDRDSRVCGRHCHDRWCWVRRGDSDGGRHVKFVYLRMFVLRFS